MKIEAILIEIPILPASYVNIEDLDSEDLESGLVWFNKNAFHIIVILFQKYQLQLV